MKVILISGKARHGKTESAKFIKSKLEHQGNKVLTTAYGNLVKFICQDYFGCDNQKNERNRTIWQRIGTDVIRKQYPNYWVDFVVGIITMFPDEWDYIIVDDCRFANELERWFGFNTINLRVNRLNFQSNLTQEQLNHISETALDDYKYFDYVINSESGLDNLEIEIDKFMKWVEIE